MKGDRPRPCWNKCGVVIVHDRYPGDPPYAGRFAWVHADNRSVVHRCANQPQRAARPADKPNLEADPWSSRAGRKGLRTGLSISDLKRGLRITGANYVPVHHQSPCTAAPWEDCRCPQ